MSENKVFRSFDEFKEYYFPNEYYDITKLPPDEAGKELADQTINQLKKIIDDSIKRIEQEREYE